MKKRFVCLFVCICMIFALIPFVSAADVPTEAEVYKRIIAVKSRYPHGTRWTNANYYSWKGGNGGASGCMGFAYLVSDAAFGSLPARTIYPKSGKPITIADLRVGDILRLPGHSVVVLEKHSDHIIIVEGNYQRQVYWGRKITAAKVKTANYYTTRYPVGYKAPTTQQATQTQSQLATKKIEASTPPVQKQVEVVKTPVPVNGKLVYFTDIDGLWSEGHIKNCLTSGLLTGTGTDDNMKFNPNKKVSRAQVVTSLYRAKGSPAVTGDVKFSDVGDTWYKNSVIWATSQGIINGVTDTTFAPDKEMTREAIITVMYRYAKSPDVQYDISKFSDYNLLFDYSKPAFAWAVKEGIVGGSNNKLNPRGYTSRSEFAAMLVRLSIAMSRA